MRGLQLGEKLRDWIHESDIPRNLFACYFIPWMYLTKHYPIGRNIYENDWDLLIVLDACRVDALQTVQDEYDFVGEVDSVLSQGSSSKEWLVNTFRQKHQREINETAYITGNGWVDEALSPSVDFSHWTVLEGSIAESNRWVHRALHRSVAVQSDFEDVWVQPMANINGIDAFPADQLTDHAIQYGRENHPDRMIVHYMQPHKPYIHRVANGQEPTVIDRQPFDLLRGSCDKDKVWDSYIDNLRYVLDEIETLLENYDAEKVVITSDHGELFGEKGLYGHAEGLPLPALRTVPWVTSSAEDRGLHSPDVDLDTQSTTDIDERLSALGYK